jgi:hypothetical protein
LSGNSHRGETPSRDLRERADTIAVGGVELRVASLPDIIKSKRAARRPRDLAVLEILDRPMKKRRTRRASLAAVARESDRNLRELIRRWQALPLERRTNFRRRRVGFWGSAL